MGLVGLLCLTAGCDDRSDEGPRELTVQRTWSPIGKYKPPGLTTAERFGYESTSAPGSGAHAGSAAAGSAHAGELVWSLPDGWTELPSSSLRQANFLVSGDERAECYLTVLSGTGGGLLANVNRWRGQMGLAAVDAESLSAAPRAQLLGAPAVVVDFEGTWSGMSGEASGDEYRLVGLLAVGEAESNFLKMIGPSELIAEQKLAFLALAASFHEDHSAHDHGDSSAAASDPHAGLDMGSVTAMAPSQSALAWKAPEGWRETAPRAMREVTFEIGDDGTAECYVALLGGDGGGAFANINRWRGQMGQGALSNAEFDDLERITMLGTEGIVVEVRGTYTGMGDDLVEQASLLGAVCQLPQKAVFVKLIGPHDLVSSVRQDFISFCQSLGQGG